MTDTTTTPAAVSSTAKKPKTNAGSFTNAERVAVLQKALAGLQAAIDAGIIGNQFTEDLPAVAIQSQIDRANSDLATLDQLETDFTNSSAQKRDALVAEETDMRNIFRNTVSAAREKRDTVIQSARKVYNDEVAAAKMEKESRSVVVKQKRSAIESEKNFISKGKAAVKQSQSTIAATIRQLSALMMLVFPHTADEKLRAAVISGNVPMIELLAAAKKK